MNVLVDYDNVPRQERNKGLVYVAERIIAAIGDVRRVNSPRIRFRLYGGWYTGQTLTRLGQTLAAEISRDFPHVMTIAAGDLAILSMELARSLEIEPARDLWHTFRRRGATEGVQCRHPTVAGCLNTPCPLLAMHDFISSGACAAPGCQILVDDLLFRSQQKLVDAMLIADLIHLARQRSQDLCIVSSDDDLWPGIRTSVLLGQPIVHLYTRPGRTTPYEIIGERLYSSGHI